MNKNYLDFINFGQSLKNFVIGAEGNISTITEKGFVIKASGTSLKHLGFKDIVECDFTGKQLSNFNKKPSIETGFHSFLLQKPNIKYIAHTHPTNVLKILCSNYNLIEEFANNRLFPDQIVFNGEKSCIVPYAHPGEELCSNIETSVEKFMEETYTFPKVILLINHGIICPASSIKECLLATSMCEKSAEIFIGAKMLGNCTFISNNNVDKIILDKNEIYRQKIII